MSVPQRPCAEIADWFLDSLDTTQRVEGTLRNVILELRQLARCGHLDEETRNHLEDAVHGLESAAGGVAVLQRASLRALRGLNDGNGSDR